MPGFALFNLNNFTPDLSHLVLIFLFLGFIAYLKMRDRKPAMSGGVSHANNINTEILRRIENRVDRIELSIKEEKKNLSYHERECYKKYTSLVSTLSGVEATVNGFGGAMKDLREQVRGVENRLLILVNRFNELNNEVRRSR